MPTYAYACTTCQHRFDAVQSFSDPALTECPQCGGRLRKEYGSIGVTFNGSGFYRTDSRATGSESGGKSSGAEKPASGPAEKSGTGDKPAGTSASGGGSKATAGAATA